MPELPDVAVFSKYFGHTALRKRVETARVLDESVIDGSSRRTFQRRLKHRELTSTRRVGKHLFVALDQDGGWLGLHFGMTGHLKYHKDAQDAPDHTRIRFDLSNGYHLSYVCQRKLGSVRIVDDLDEFVRDRELGPDALECSRERFKKRLRGRRGGIKSALMNQSIVCGIGNVYADEVLFSARLHPEYPVADLDEEALDSLYEAVQAVLRAAIDAEADPTQMPGSFILPDRTEGAPCSKCRGRISKIEVVSRSTYFCPSCQPRP